MNKTPLFCSLIILCVALFGCDSRVIQISGGSGTETVGITGFIVDSNNFPVSGARVMLRRADYIDQSSSQGLSKEVLLRSGTVETNDSGRFSFEGVDTGAFSIEVSDANHNGALLPCTVNTNDSLYALGVHVLRPTGVITGKISPLYSGQVVTASVYGLDAKANSDASGNFILNDIPEGTYKMRFNGDSRVFNSFDTAKITITAGMKHDVGQVALQQKKFTIFPGDSAIISQILLGTGISVTSLFHAKNIEISGLLFRVSLLNLDNLHIKTLPPIIGELDQLQTLSLENDSLSSLPQEVWKLQHLKNLILKKNKFYSLPGEITKVESLQALDVSFNHLSALPDGMQYCRSLVDLDLGFNQFSSISSSVFHIITLKSLSINNNSLDSLPSFYNNQALRGLNYLDASYNKLTTLPLEITYLDPSHFSCNFDNNELCESTLQAKIWPWLDSVSQDSTNWSSTQNCP